jgi:membrane-bound lytic murein transglycosylase A
VRRGAFLLALLLSACIAPPPGEPPPTLSAPAVDAAVPPAPMLVPAAWADLPGWMRDRPAALLPALAAQCAGPRTPAAEPPGLVPAEALATPAWWRALCAEASRARTDAAARRLIERRFRPVRLVGSGLATGYFEPVYAGCPAPAPGCETPARGRPPGLVDADARRIDPAAAAARIRGCVDRGVLAPCPDRAAIEAGAMPDAPALAWMDRVEKFFMQIQGSGRLALPDGRTLRLGYAAQNGGAYVPIGRVLLEAGEIGRPVSMQSIRAWLDANPSRAEAVLNRNPAYVFFAVLDLPDDAGPIGSLGVPLTAGRSIAVDPRVVPLGLPVFAAIEGLPPRVVLAQDTGGAIRGPGRIDLFTGTGPAAGEVAGRLAAPATLWLLLPALSAGPP